MRYLPLIFILITLPAFAEMSVKTCNNLIEYPEILKQVKNNDNFQTDILIQTFENLINNSLTTDNNKLKLYQDSISQIQTNVQKWYKITLSKLQKCEKYWQYTIDKNLGKYYGLIIGINNYRYWPKLTTAINDAKMINEILSSKYSFNNKLLINPSYQKIISTFKNLKNKLGKNDNLLIYYAGRSHKDTDGQSYWLPSDATKNTQLNWLKTNLITSNLLIKKNNIRNVLIISDSFYSTDSLEIKPTSPPQPAIKKLLNQLPKYMLTDSKIGLLKKAIEKSRILLENNKNQPIIGNNSHSIVAQNLLAELHKGKTIFTARNLVNNMLQTLEYKVIDPDSRGDFVFKQPHKFIDNNDITLQKQSLFLTKLAHKEIAKGNTTNGMLFTLEALPKHTFAPERPYTFVAEEKMYEAILKQREYKIITGHKQPIQRIAFSPDGLYIATASIDGQVRLWDNHGKLLNILQIGLQDLSRQNKFWTPSIAFTDSQLIAGMANDNAARIWNIKTGQLEKILYGHQKGINHIAVNPITNRVLTVAEDARLWKTGKLFHLLTGHKKTINFAAFSPDGKIIATASDDNTTRLWKNGELLHTLIGHTDKVNHVSFSPNGKTIVTVSNDNTARLWENGESVAVFRGHSDNVLNSAFSPDGRFIITVSKDKTAHLWKADKLQKILSGHQQALTFAAFSPSGKYIIL
ncbi:MAG: caspase family protein, partial [Candidatus Marithrix sp.]|nr:caspase family protein [Candidatus Marithrix sp.]